MFRTAPLLVAAATASAALGFLPLPSACLAADPVIVLYDAAGGSTPSSQGWAYLTDPLFFAQSRQSLGDGTAILDSTAAIGEKAGWFSNLPPFPPHPRQPALDAAAGFVVGFHVRIGTETHNRPDRAGFSVIATASNLSAIELGFWTDTIWAQSGPDFRHAEEVRFDTTSGVIRYELVLHGDRYQLSADGRSLLGGMLRRYDSFGAPYHLPSFLFLGDDTTSAAARIGLSRVTVMPLPRIEVGRDGSGVRISVEAETGRTVVFEASEDLVSWTEAGTAVSVEGTARLTVAAEGGRRYFRSALR